ncbi:MAG: hypothetical protein PHC75_09550, partial [Burkholderiales bacterium]|nr:hypothetical protein [Burkholderiales bacterium]
VWAQRQRKAFGLTAQCFVKIHNAEMFIPYLSDMQESKIYKMTGDGDYCSVFNPFIENKVNAWTFTYENLQENNFGIKYSKDEDPDDGRLYCHHSDNSYWNEIYSGKNMYQQNACIGIIIDKHGFYHSIMYWVDNDNSKDISKSILNSAAINLGSAAGYLDENKNAIIGLGGWVIPLDSTILQSDGKCSGKITKNSLFINLDEYLKFNQSLGSGHKDDSAENLLSRLEDKKHDKSDPDNLNSLKTDIFLDKNSIVFDKDGKSKLSVITKNNALGYNYHALSLSGSIQADWINTNMQQIRFANCTASESNMIVKEKFVLSEAYKLSGNRKLLKISSDFTEPLLICKKDLRCSSADYCFVPVTDHSINYTFSVLNSHWTRGETTITCPDNTYLDTSKKISKTEKFMSTTYNATTKAKCINKDGAIIETTYGCTLDFEPKFTFFKKTIASKYSLIESATLSYTPTRWQASVQPSVQSIIFDWRSKNNIISCDCDGREFTDKYPSYDTPWGHIDEGTCTTQPDLILNN